MPFAPARCARRVARLSLIRAFGWHLLMLALVTASLVVIGSTAEALDRSWRSDQRSVELAAVLADAWRELDKFRKYVRFRDVLLALGGLELAFVLCAVLLLPWAAYAFKLRDAFRHTLLVVWVSTAHWIFMGLIPLAVFAAWCAYGDHLRANHPEYFNPQYGYLLYDRDSPWIMWNGEFVVAWTCVAVGAWILWSWIRAVAVGHEPDEVSADPCCESCGYNLLHIPVTGRCPECGESAAASIPPNLRRRFAWEEGPAPAFFSMLPRATAAVFMSRPALFREVPVRSGQGRASRYCLQALLVASVVAFPALCLLYWADTGRPLPKLEHDGAYFTFAVAGAFGIGWGLISVAGLFVGLWRTWGDGRNQMPAAGKAAMYCSGFIVLWELHFTTVMLLLFAFERPLRRWSRAWFNNSDMLAIALFIAANLICFAILVTGINHGARAMRFANR